ncbi:MAG TPA: cell division topological specificity factor MinE [Candidatus Nitrosotalea sp.]|nr:cell division topological specificity factor MinE [Candidatus Nitrosotalea sp.]
MIEFLKRLFRQQSSSATAKERLRLVLMTDHLELAPEMIEKMKRDLVDLISRYVEVDRERIDVTFERQDATLAMLANIPILSVNRPNGNGAHKEPPEAAAEPKAAEPVATVAPAQTDTKPPVRKRKRRKKASSTRSSSPSPA